MIKHGQGSTHTRKKKNCHWNNVSFDVGVFCILTEKMKFAVQKIGESGARLGVLYDIGRHCEKAFRTPMCFVYTSKGSVPHLSYETLQLLTKDCLPVVLPLVSLAETYEAVKKFSKGIGAFIGLQEYVLYTSIQDPAVRTLSGYNDKNGVSLWPKSGRNQLNVGKFMDIQEAFCPDMYQALCDSDTDKNSSKKRIRKSVERTLDYLDGCIEIHNKSEKLSKTAIFGTIEGGFDLEARKKSAKLTACRPVAGFIIDGFNCYGPETEGFEFEEIKDILKATLEHLPADKPRMMHCVWRPDNVIRAVESGIDLFDASYPYILTQRGTALVLPLQYSKAKPLLSDAPLINGDMRQPNVVEINLEAQMYKEDMSPILEGCKCYTCRRFTKAYVHHLLVTSEMLAQVLLMIHNLYHYMSFFETIQKALEEDDFNKMKAHVLSVPLL